MVVVCVLLLIVISATMQFLLDIVARERQGVVTKRVSEQTMVALDQMGNDIRSAVSRQRATGGGLGLDDLDVVSTGVVPAGAARRDYVNEMLDVISVSPWHVEVMVPRNGTTSCVRFEAVQATGRLTRYAAPTCPAHASTQGVSAQTIIGEVPDGVDPVAPFSFTWMSTAAGCPVATIANTPAIDALSTSTTVAQYQRLNRLASVKVNLAAYGMAGFDRAVAKAGTEYAFRSRLSQPYRRALGGGCDA